MYLHCSHARCCGWSDQAKKGAGRTARERGRCVIYGTKQRAVAIGAHTSRLVERTLLRADSRCQDGAHLKKKRRIMLGGTVFWLASLRRFWGARENLTCAVWRVCARQNDAGKRMDGRAGLPRRRGKGGEAWWVAGEGEGGRVVEKRGWMDGWMGCASVRESGRGRCDSQCSGGSCVTLAGAGGRFRTGDSGGGGEGGLERQRKAKPWGCGGEERPALRAPG